jgi:heme exporter protein D
MNPFDLGPHAAFILWSYAVTFAVLGGLVAWAALDYRGQVARLKELEARGLTRRSARRRGEGAAP